MNLSYVNVYWHARYQWLTRGSDLVSSIKKASGFGWWHVNISTVLAGAHAKGAIMKTKILQKLDACW